MTLYTLSLKPEYVVRIWDNFIVKGFGFIYQAALAILYFNRQKMLIMDFTEMIEVLSDI